jgi:hypothetical protein
MNDDRTTFRTAYAHALAGFLADARAAALLAAIPASAWNRSGCMAFATAVVDCLGGTLMSIGWYALLADYVVVSVGGMFLDAEGTYSEAEILAKYCARARAACDVAARAVDRNAAGGRPAKPRGARGIARIPSAEHDRTSPARVRNRQRARAEAAPSQSEGAACEPDCAEVA